MPNALGRDDLNETWEKFWASNGERLIWSSWIEKYSDYIHPTYTGNSIEQLNDSTPMNTDSNNFSFEQNTDTVIDNNNKIINSTEIIVSSCSPAANVVEMTDEGWNPLSPINSMDDNTWNTYRVPLCENDSLLSPRCESVTSSIPLTIGTTDSMTNVTQMTVSSYEFCGRGRADDGGSNSRMPSESSQLSGSVSSPDIGTSSISSMSQPLENGDDVNTAYLLDDTDTTMDVDQYWQILWHKHFQEQYVKHYKLFIENVRPIANKQCDISSSLRSPNTYNYSVFKYAQGTYDEFDEKESGSKNKMNKKNQGNIQQECLPSLVSNLNIHQSNDISSPALSNADTIILIPPTKIITASTNVIDVNSCVGSAGECVTDAGNTDCKSANSKDNVDEVDFTSQLLAMGLPTEFGRSLRDSGGDGDKPPDDDKPINLKRRHESDTEEPPVTDRIKAAFLLMGFSFNDKPDQDNSSNNNIIGEVVYRKKHIRLHNRNLKMKHNKPVHIYFDDDGNEIQKINEVS